MNTPVEKKQRPAGSWRNRRMDRRRATLLIVDICHRYLVVCVEFSKRLPST